MATATTTAAMATITMLLLVAIARLSVAATTAIAPSTTTVTLDWSVGWVSGAAPDGGPARRVIGVNGIWPIPPVHATIGDTFVLNVHNALDSPTAVHFHGLFQNSTPFFDGAAGVSECAIPSGRSFSYRFVIAQTGTFWIHGHYSGQYVDGFRTPFILHPRQSSNITASGIPYDEEIIMSLSDWYHQEHEVLVKPYLSIYNPMGFEPVPESALINHEYAPVFSITPGRTYLIRTVSMAAFASFYFHIDDHPLTIVEIDGQDVKPYQVAHPINIAAAQRYSFILKAKPSADFNYVVHCDIDTDMFDTVPDSLNPLINGTLQYNPAAPLFVPEPDPASDPDAAEAAGGEAAEMAMFSESVLEPVIPMAPIKPDQTFVLNVDFQVFEDGVNYGTFNTTIFHSLKVPSILTALTMGNLANDPAVYGPTSMAIVADHLNGIELVVNNFDAGNHPFHLHGHAFQIISVSADGPFDPLAPLIEPANPVRRDTVVIPGEGHAVIRFVADNPGVWFFHCHIEWHFRAGLAALIVEAPTVLQQLHPISTLPPSFTSHCLELGHSVSGNAMGYNDTTSFNGVVALKLFPEGFTPKGIIALMTTMLSAVLGIAVVVWYASTDAPVSPTALSASSSSDRRGVVTDASPASASSSTSLSSTSASTARVKHLQSSSVRQ